jgi:hypothetical protein
VVSTVGLLEKLRRGCSVIAKDTETVREIQRVYRIRVFTMILQEVFIELDEGELVISPVAMAGMLRRRCYLIRARISLGACQ